MTIDRRDFLSASASPATLPFKPMGHPLETQVCVFTVV